MITPARFGDARTRPIYRPEGMHSQAAAVRTLGATPHADDVEDVTHLGGFDAHGLGQLAAQLGNAAVPRDGDGDLDADVPLPPKACVSLRNAALQCVKTRRAHLLGVLGRVQPCEAHERPELGLAGHRQREVHVRIERDRDLACRHAAAPPAMPR